MVQIVIECRLPPPDLDQKKSSIGPTLDWTRRFGSRRRSHSTGSSTPASIVSMLSTTRSTTTRTGKDFLPKGLPIRDLSARLSTGYAKRFWKRKGQFLGETLYLNGGNPG
jgi:hypothetical protein